MNIFCLHYLEREFSWPIRRSDGLLGRCEKWRCEYFLSCYCLPMLKAYLTNPGTLVWRIRGICLDLNFSFPWRFRRKDADATHCRASLREWEGMESYWNWDSIFKVTCVSKGVVKIRQIAPFKSILTSTNCICEMSFASSFNKLIKSSILEGPEEGWTLEGNSPFTQFMSLWIVFFHQEDELVSNHEIGFVMSKSRGS